MTPPATAAPREPAAFGPRCLVCGEAKFSFLAVTPPGRWVRCGGCGLVRQDDPPPIAVTQGTYGFSPAHEGIIPAETWNETSPDPHSLFKYWIVWQVLSERGLSGRLLDVGCGNGLLQDYFRKRGWTDTVGVEPSGNPTGRARLGVTVYNESLEEFGRRRDMRESFDVGVANHVLEHCYEPAAFLRQLRALLRPGAHLFLATPNIGGLSMRWKTWMSRLGWKKRPFRHLDYPKHLILFRPSNLSRLVESAGFRIEDVETCTRLSRDSSREPARARAWDRLGLGDNMFLVAQKPAGNPAN